MFYCLALLLPLSAVCLIPRNLLFSDPKYSSLSLSPDGRFVGYISPDNGGVKNVFARSIASGEARQVTFEKKSNVLEFYWTGVPDVILYTQDNNGDENTMIFHKNISNAALKKAPNARVVISNQPRVKAIIIENNRRHQQVLIGLNDEVLTHHNIYRFDLITNEKKLVLKNTRFSSFVVDNDLKLRLAAEEQQDGTMVYFKPTTDKPRGTGADEWIEHLRIELDDRAITLPLKFDKENKNMYWIWGADSDLGTLVRINIDKPQQKETLYRASKSQIFDILFHPEEKNLLSVTEMYRKRELFATKAVLEDLQYLLNLRPKASLTIIGLSQDMNTWLVSFDSSEKSTEYFVYHRGVKKADLLFNSHPQLAGYRFNSQIGFEFRARDGLKLQAYLSLPPRAKLLRPEAASLENRDYAALGMIPSQPQKMVVLVHGGPNGRDVYGFSSANAFLTDRGYAVLQVNFRGSVGYGKSLANAGNGEWARKMHQDLLDGVEFAVAKRIARRDQIAIMGTSYGGYATLVGLTFTPDVFVCGVDIVGPSNLVSLFGTIPPYWKGLYQSFVKMIGADPTTDTGKQLLVSRSPLFFADRVEKPIMVIQGANDPRVNKNESDQFVEALKKKNIPVTYILYPDEGHGVKKANNRLAQYGYIEHFFHGCLGGKQEDYLPGQYKSTAILKENGYAPSEPPMPFSKEVNQSSQWLHPVLQGQEYVVA